MTYPRKTNKPTNRKPKTTRLTKAGYAGWNAGLAAGRLGRAPPGIQQTRYESRNQKAARYDYNTQSRKAWLQERRKRAYDYKRNVRSASKILDQATCSHSFPFSDPRSYIMIENPSQGKRVHALPILLAGLLAMTAFSGCLSWSREDATKVVAQSSLAGKRWVLKCTVSTHGQGGVYAALLSCDNEGNFAEGEIGNATLVSSGTDDTGSFDANRCSDVVFQMYYPKKKGNSVPFTVHYCTENGHKDDFSIVFETPVHKTKYGKYSLCFTPHNFKNVAWFSRAGAYEGRADQPDPEQTCKTYKISKKGGS